MASFNSLVLRQIVELLSTRSVLCWKIQQPGRQEPWLFCSLSASEQLGPRRVGPEAGPGVGAHIMCAWASPTQDVVVMWAGPERGSFGRGVELEAAWAGEGRRARGRACRGFAVLIPGQVGAVLIPGLNLHDAWPFLYFRDILIIFTWRMPFKPKDLELSHLTSTFSTGTAHGQAIKVSSVSSLSFSVAKPSTAE